ncbi:MAG: hypothetical protein Q7R47_00425 [Candidatus Diapherotrites archaeon]|nr:hypothetical protein [Candidatus Diapherotrites archaeon]
MLRTKRIKGNEAILGNGFEFRDPKTKTVTRIYKIQGLDLVVEQQTKGEEPVFLAHYSNPGIPFYALLTKFLSMHVGAPVHFVSPKARRQDEFDHQAKLQGIGVASSQFPYQYKYGVDAEPVRVHHTHRKGEPELEFRTEQGTITLSKELVHALADKIPDMYPHNRFFQELEVAYDKQVRRHPEFLRLPMQQRPLTGKQNEFKFMHRGTKRQKPKTPREPRLRAR